MKVTEFVYFFDFLNVPPSKIVQYNKEKNKCIKKEARRKSKNNNT